jgi:hypothetical protein
MNSKQNNLDYQHGHTSIQTMDQTAHGKGNSSSMLHNHTSNEQSTMIDNSSILAHNRTGNENISIRDVSDSKVDNFID